jgi:histidine triad (HIT) family protein
MTADCVFCAIASGTEPAQFVWDDPTCVDFMASTPINRGHLLIIPRRHVETMFDLDDDAYAHLSVVGKRLALAVNGFIKPVRVGMVVAGWDIPHAHLHVIPMHDYHDITSRGMLAGTLPKATPGELSTVAEQLRRTIR